MFTLDSSSLRNPYAQKIHDNSARFLDMIHTAQTPLYGGRVSSFSPFLDSLTLPLRRLTQLFWFRDPPLPTFFARNFLSGSYGIVLKAS